jgi:hypothetical protein
VLPERGLLFWLFSFFFLWTLWNNQFSLFDARRLLRSLAVLFGTAFVLKHMLLAALYAPEGGWLKKLAGVLLEGVSLGTLDTQAFAPATGYISFFTLALYVTGLIVLLMPAIETDSSESAHMLLRSYHKLPAAERLAVREAITGEVAESVSDAQSQLQLTSAELSSDLRHRPSEETVIARKPDAS